MVLVVRTARLIRGLHVIARLHDRCGPCVAAILGGDRSNYGTGEIGVRGCEIGRPVVQSSGRAWERDAVCGMRYAVLR